MCPQVAQSTETLALSLLCLHAWEVGQQVQGPGLHRTTRVQGE